jgi:hypothetical protein
LTSLLEPVFGLLVKTAPLGFLVLLALLKFLLQFVPLCDKVALLTSEFEQALLLLEQRGRQFGNAPISRAKMFLKSPLPGHQGACSPFVALRLPPQFPSEVCVHARSSGADVATIRHGAGCGPIALDQPLDVRFHLGQRTGGASGTVRRGPVIGRPRAAEPALAANIRGRLAPWQDIELYRPQLQAVANLENGSSERAAIQLVVGAQAFHDRLAAPLRDDGMQGTHAWSGNSNGTRGRSTDRALRRSQTQYLRRRIRRETAHPEPAAWTVFGLGCESVIERFLLVHHDRIPTTSRQP